VIKSIHSSKFGLDRVVDFGRQEALLRVRASQIGEKNGIQLALAYPVVSALGR
jgi:hypothetical protein